MDGWMDGWKVGRVDEGNPARPPFRPSTQFRAAVAAEAEAGRHGGGAGGAGDAEWLAAVPAEAKTREVLAAAVRADRVHPRGGPGASESWRAFCS